MLSCPCVALKGFVGSGSKLSKPTKVSGTVQGGAAVVYKTRLSVWFLLFHTLSRTKETQS